jgi:hypothetical protein
VAFAGPDDRTVLVARANLAILIRNVGNSLTRVSQFAREIDKDLSSIPDMTGEKIYEMEKFSIPDQEFRVGDEVPIRISQPDLPDAKLLYKFFSSSGEAFFRENQLLYRPDTAGPQHLIAFALGAGKSVAVQRLYLDVGPRSLVEYEKELAPLKYFSPMSHSNTDWRNERIPQKSLGSNQSVQLAGGRAMNHQMQGTWTSYRPAGPAESDPRTDLTPDGRVYIGPIDVFTGHFTGTFEDLSHHIEDVEGVITFIGGSTYSVVLQHLFGEDHRTRRYEGQLVAENADVCIVVGRFARVDTNAVRTPVVAAATAQEEGIWVATKP